MAVLRPEMLQTQTQLQELRAALPAGAPGHREPAADAGGAAPPTTSPPCSVAWRRPTRVADLQPQVRRRAEACRRGRRPRRRVRPREGRPEPASEPSATRWPPRSATSNCPGAGRAEGGPEGAGQGRPAPLVAQPQQGDGRRPGGGPEPGPAAGLHAGMGGRPLPLGRRDQVEPGHAAAGRHPPEHDQAQPLGQRPAHPARPRLRHRRGLPLAAGGHPLQRPRRSAARRCWSPAPAAATARPPWSATSPSRWPRAAARC